MLVACCLFPASEAVIVVSGDGSVLGHRQIVKPLVAYT